MGIFWRSAVFGAGLLAASTGPQVWADQGGDFGGHGIKRVLLISIDGMHAVDFANCTSGLAGINGGASYCPNLAALGETGTTYTDTSTSKPSDSFPGLMALMTGGSPRTVGAFYDVAYDRSLDPPAATTGNGVAGAPDLCTPGAPPTGTRTEFDEGIDINKLVLNGGAPAGLDGGIASIDPSKLERDPAHGCAPVYPWNFIRTNTIFGVVHAAGGYTAWSDKHPSYSAVSGPGNGTNVDDYYAPEINSIPVALPVNATPGLACNPLPDQTAVAASNAWTDSFANIQCYDSLKVQAILNEIAGKDHSGTRRRPVPNVFGMNFQAVSVGQKLIETSIGVTGGYQDNIGTPTPALLNEIEFADSSIGKMVAALKQRGLYQSTMIIISAKHGQSPIELGPISGDIDQARRPGDDLAGDDPGEPAAIFRVAAEPQRDRPDRGRRLADLAGGFGTDRECGANAGKPVAGDQQHRRHRRDFLRTGDRPAVQPAGAAAERRPAHPGYPGHPEYRRHLFGKRQEARRTWRLRARRHERDDAGRQSVDVAVDRDQPGRDRPDRADDPGGAGPRSRQADRGPERRHANPARSRARQRTRA